MVIQLSDKDNAKDVLEFENLNSQDNDISEVVELLRSELLFERAVSTVNLNVSLFSRGKVLTEEKYLSSIFNVQPYHLYDSSLISLEIGVEYSDDILTLSYPLNGKTKKLKGKLDTHLINEEMDIVVKSSNPSVLRKSSRQNELFFTFNSVKSVSKRLITGLEVTALDVNAKTIDITFKGHNPQLCHDMTLALANSFTSYDEEIKRQGSENVLNFIDEQLDSLESELKSSKDSLSIFQRKAQMPDPEMIGTSISDNVSTLQDQLFIVEEELNALMVAGKMLQKNPNRLEVYRMLPEMLGRSYEQSLVKHLNELHNQLEAREDLLFSVTQENEGVLKLTRKIKSKIEMIQRSIDAIDSRLHSNAGLLQSKINSLQSEIFDLPEKKMEFNRLKGIQDLNEKYFSLLTEKKVLYAISDAGYASANRVLKQPAVNYEPVAPNKNFIYGSFIFFGLILGFGIMFLKYLTFNQINLLEDLANILPEKASILGGVPLFKYAMEYSQVVVAEAPKSMMAEAMRKIRTNLSYVHPNYKTIAISSSISGEGKTFVALNLGGIIAMSGKKTILLDLDLRKPKVHLGFDVDNAHGMSSLIVGHSTIDECIKKSAIPELDFITAGPIPPNPSELILSQGYQDVIDELKKLYDVVIIDNPPVGLVSDGVRNLTEADIPIYVFKSQYSKRNFASRIEELFEVQQLKSLNVILNGVKSNNGSAYGYGYGYGYGNGYLDDEPDKFKKAARAKKWYRKMFKSKKKD